MANLTLRLTTGTGITTVGRPLTISEVESNFTNLNTQLSSLFNSTAAGAFKSAALTADGSTGDALSIGHTWNASSSIYNSLLINATNSAGTPTGAGAFNLINAKVGNVSMFSVDYLGNVIVGGNLTISGTTTTVNTVNLAVKDVNIQLGNVATPTDVTAAGGGITLMAGAGNDKTITWNNASTGWESSESIQIPATKAFRIAGVNVLTSTGLALAPATPVTTYSPVLNLSQNWNNAGVNFGGILVNITDSASSAGTSKTVGSTLVDLQVGGVSKFQVDKSGTTWQPFGGTTRVLTPPGGALVREFADITAGTVVTTTGAIETGISYNAPIDSATGNWLGRDIQDICWVEKYSDATPYTKQIWYSASATAGTAPTVWAKRYEFNMETGSLSIAGGFSAGWLTGNLVARNYSLIADQNNYRWDGTGIGGTGAIAAILDSLIYNAPALIFKRTPSGNAPDNTYAQVFDVSTATIKWKYGQTAVGAYPTVDIMTLGATGTLSITGAFTSSGITTGGLSNQLYASSATSSGTGYNSNWLRSAKNTVSVFVGDADSVSAYTNSDFSGNIRFNGSGILWGDFGYYPKDTNPLATGSMGQFRFAVAGGVVQTTPNASVGVGSLISQGPMVQPFAGLTRVMTPGTGALVREYCDIAAPALPGYTSGAIEWMQSYNVNLGTMTRDGAGASWFYKYTDADPFKFEYWFSPSSGTTEFSAFSNTYSLNIGTGDIWTAGDTSTNTLSFNKVQHFTTPAINPVGARGQHKISQEVLSRGKCLHPDKTFTYGLNGVWTYNNLANGNVTVTRQPTKTTSLVASSSGVWPAANGTITLQAANANIKVGMVVVASGYFYGGTHQVTAVNGTTITLNFAASSAVPNGTSITFYGAEDCPSESDYMLQIQTSGTASPGFGGWYFADMTRKNGSLSTIFNAKIPVGYSVNFASNSVGSTGSQYFWVTPQKGTGKWEDYAFLVKAGVTSAGQYALWNTNFYYLTAPTYTKTLTATAVTSTTITLDSVEDIAIGATLTYLGAVPTTLTVVSISGLTVTLSGAVSGSAGIGASFVAPTPSVGSPLTWFLSYATSYDMDSAEVANGVIQQNFAGMTSVKTPLGGALVREFADVGGVTAAVSVNQVAVGTQLTFGSYLANIGLGYLVTGTNIAVGAYVTNIAYSNDSVTGESTTIVTMNAATTANVTTVSGAISINPPMGTTEIGTSYNYDMTNLSATGAYRDIGDACWMEKTADASPFNKQIWFAPSAVATTPPVWSKKFELSYETGSLKVAGGLGYLAGQGVGATVRQATSKGTAVTINALTGKIQTVTAAVTAAVPFIITVANNTVGFDDTIIINQVGGAVWFRTQVQVTNGAFNLWVEPVTTSASDSVAFNFTVIKGSTT